MKFSKIEDRIKRMAAYARKVAKKKSARGSKPKSGSKMVSLDMNVSEFTTYRCPSCGYHYSKEPDQECSHCKKD